MPPTSNYTDEQAKAVAYTLSHACCSALYHQPTNNTLKTILQQIPTLCLGLLKEETKKSCKSKLSLSIRYLMRRHYKELYWQDRQRLRESHHMLQ